MAEVPKKSDIIVHTMKCPECNSDKANVITHLLDIPHYEDFMMVSINCPECKFRASDFFHSNPKPHIKSTYTVKGKEDMGTKIVRASDGFVTIPELGVTIEPITGSNTWIRNVEGVLNDVKTKITFTLNNAEDNKTRDKSNELLELIDKMINYELVFTIIVEDIYGNSIILPAIEDHLIIEQFELHDKSVSN